MTSIKEALEKRPETDAASAAALERFCRKAGITKVEELADSSKATLARMEELLGRDAARLAASAAHPLLADEGLGNGYLVLKM